MRDWIVRGGTAAVAVLMLAGVTAGQTTLRSLGAPKWHTDYEWARKIALANGKPLFVVFRCQH